MEAGQWKPQAKVSREMGRIKATIMHECTLLSGDLQRGQRGELDVDNQLLVPQGALFLETS
jgi:hypothetical protein